MIQSSMRVNRLRWRGQPVWVLTSQEGYHPDVIFKSRLEHYYIPSFNAKKWQKVYIGKGKIITMVSRSILDTERAFVIDILLNRMTLRKELECGDK